MADDIVKRNLYYFDCIECGGKKRQSLLIDRAINGICGNCIKIGEKLTMEVQK